MNPFKAKAAQVAKAKPQKKSRAKTASETASETASKTATEDMLNDDLARIKALPTNERITLKQKLLNKFNEVFLKKTDAPNWGKDLVIFWNIVWLFDVGNFADGFKYAKLGFERNLTIPFKSTFATFVADTIFQATKSATTKANAEPYLVAMVDLISHGLDVNPAIHAKIFKLYGDTIIDELPLNALDFFEKAHKVDESIGVKKRIAGLQQKLNIKSE